MNKYRIIFTLFPIFIFACGASQDLLPYKKLDKITLYLEAYYPENFNKSEKNAAIVFFFGGGWQIGDRHHFKNQAKYLSKRGITCFLADYRIKSKHGTTPFDALKDAKSAIRFLRIHADSIGIDPEKIIAAGGSAGGHLAAATALINGYNHQDDDLSISCVPNALILFNPVIDNGPGGYGYEMISDAYLHFSPLHNIRPGAPPTLFLLGNKDRLVPLETGMYYQKVMERVGSLCELKIYEGGHGFFNYDHFKNYKKTLEAADEFLQSLNYLEPEPEIQIK